MSDITMCHGFDCPVKEKCKRFSSKPNKHWQAYFLSPPYTITDNVFVASSCTFSASRFRLYI